MSIWFILACTDPGEIAEFPDLLEAIEEMKVEPPAGTMEEPYPETYTVLSGDTGEYGWVHLRGYIHRDLSSAWEGLRDDRVYVNQRETTDYTITEIDSDIYDYVYQVHNYVENILTIEFTNEWRHAATEGTREVPEEITVRWQKIEGTEFIASLEGSVRILPVSDETRKDVVEVQIIEHITATMDQEESARVFVEDMYERWLLVTQGEDIPEYE